MMKNKYYFESTALTGGLKFGYRIRKKILVKKTPYQKIEVYETDKFGRVLFLNGITQITEKDEFHYHEMIAHVPMLSHPNPQNVLIIGGGDGGVLREVLKYPIKKVDLVEIDQEVINLSKKYFPKIVGGAFKDNRTKIHIADGIEFVKKCKEKYDIIIIDSSDPIGPAEMLFSFDFYKNIKRCLDANGLIVLQSGCVFLQINQIVETFKKMQKIFRYTNIYLADIPSYFGGIFSFMINSKNLNFKNINSQKLITARYKKLGLQTEYYDPRVHVASFILPIYLRNKIS